MCELGHTDGNLCFKKAGLLLKGEPIIIPVNELGIDHLRWELTLALMDHSGSIYLSA